MKGSIYGKDFSKSASSFVMLVKIDCNYFISEIQMTHSSAIQINVGGLKSVSQAL